MKSLFTSTAAFAVAISLASVAHAEDEPVNAAPLINGEVSQTQETDKRHGKGAIVAYEKTAPDAFVFEPFWVESTQETVTIRQQAPLADTDRLGGPAVTIRGLDPRYGDIDAFYGDIDAFWGDISPFYGDIDAFYGDISPFYGDISAFWGDIDAFYGDIGAFDASKFEAHGQFWESARTQISATETIWNKLKYEADGVRYRLEYNGTPSKVIREFNKLISQAEAQFGAAYTQKTGKDFRNDFVAGFLAKHGINMKRKVSFAGFSASDRASFFLDWHDSLNQYSGIDQVDHWMGMVNWTPSITQIQGDGKGTIIGVVDGSFASDADLGNNIIWSGGHTNAVQGHGVGVASLIAGDHDGQGVMGIAPDVHIATYNPFAADGTATYEDVASGIIQMLKLKRDDLNDTGQVSIINLSLGEKGWVLAQGMANVLRHDKIKGKHNKTVFVVAAGNEGVSQSQSVELQDPEKLALILVGSLDLDGKISSFSNRPGSATLLDNGQAKQGNELFRRFIVAPGELILVSDGNGGVMRRSGTSFAAPLVSGAVSLLHDRWPWLAKKPLETAEIIFRSAKDLGAPGPDEVYGWGLLDVAASQSPLDFNEMQFKLFKRQGNKWENDAFKSQELLSLGIPSWWETDDVFFTGFEGIGSTDRDFAIPMSAFSYGNSTDELGNGLQRLQDFVGRRMAKWLKSQGKDKNGDGKNDITQVRSSMAETSGQWTMRFDAMEPRFTQDGAMREVHSAATLTDPSQTMSFTLGHGQGALALSGGSFGIISDHDYSTGGVNPLLGFASGELFAAASYKPASATTLRFGYSKDREDWRDFDGPSDINRSIQRQLGAREAEAITVGLEQKITGKLTVDAQWTRLTEKDALLGAQTSVEAFLGEGSQTDAVTITAATDFGNGLSVDLSATGSATQADEGQLLATSQQAVSTAAQFSVNKRGVMGERDILRLSVGQPLMIERGQLELRSEQVVDRQTGERGIVSQFIGIETKRRYSADFVYATPVTAGSELGVVGRYVSAGGQGQTESFMIGANLAMRF